ncbi:hypothetical protein [Rhizobium tubonense]|nr:hypothetical protein [Rhizobium tubonense]
MPVHPPKLSQFVEAHPGTDISVLLDDRNVRLIEQGIDVALRMGLASIGT